MIIQVLMSPATPNAVNKSYDINQTVTYEVEQLFKCIHIYIIYIMHKLTPKLFMHTIQTHSIGIICIHIIIYSGAVDKMRYMIII